ncbi:MAG: DUF4358 domain-containing protein [Solobacterium sp.]|nr:DUF4358 domain-containing protein [Solobacterium sp.]MBQ6356349.1 DUF4358 domain-containing protein [Solobacterium sp.]MBQ6531750.1 DUF4358 domain-containing protein [Solobacterium sp.]MBR0213188.1 DUF4358 domain-containing protein [Solobacterium sp.]
MKKLIMAAAICLLLGGCGAKPEKTAPAGKTFQDYEAILTPFLDEKCSTLDKDQVAKMLDVDPETVVNAAGYFEDEHTERRILIIEADSEDHAMEAEEKMNDYLSTLVNSAAMYRPEELETIAGGYVGNNGTYAFLIICEDIQEAKKALLE